MKPNYVSITFVWYGMSSGKPTEKSIKVVCVPRIGDTVHIDDSLRIVKDVIWFVDGKTLNCVQVTLS